MWLIRFAWKNLLRHYKRALITLIFITIGSSGLMLMAGFGLFTYQSLEERSARSTGHLILSHPHYFEKQETNIMDLGLSNANKIIQKLSTNPDITYALPVTHFQGLISNDYKTTTFIGRGIEPKEIRLRGPFINIIQGGNLSHQVKRQVKQEAEVLLGEGLAKNLQVNKGDFITLLSNTVEGSLNGYDAKVVGIFSTGIPQMDKRLVFTHNQLASKLLMTKKVSTINIYGSSLSLAETLKIWLNKNFPNLKTTLWEERAFFYKGVKNLYNNIFGFIGGIASLIIFFAVFNTMSMAVWERTREIATLSAMGTYSKEIIISLLIEGVLLSLISAIASLIVYAGISILLLFAGIEMPPPPAQTTGYPLQVSFSFEVYLVVTGITLLVVSSATLIASSRVNRLSIVKALSHT